MKKLLLSLILIVSIGIFFMPVQGEPIPSWVKSMAKLYADGKISDEEYVRTLQRMVDVGIIKIQDKSTKSSSDAGIKASALEYCQILKSWNEQYKGSKWLTIETKKEFDKLCTSKSSSQTTLTNTKLLDLLPSESDIDPQWREVHSSSSGKPTKDNFYKAVGQKKWTRDAPLVKEFRMNIFEYENSDIAETRYQRAYKSNMETLNYYSSKTKVDPGENCHGINVDHKTYDQLYGFCIIGKIVIYMEINGYYPEMKDDFKNFLQISKNKVLQSGLYK